MMRSASHLVAVSVLLASALSPPRTLWAQQDTTRIVVYGVVGDAVAGAPLEGAVASIPELKLRALTDTAGRFVLSGVPVGSYTWRFQMLGYADWEEEMAVVDGEFLRVGLLPRPIVLENITAAVDRLARRRDAVPYSVFVLSRDEIEKTGTGTAAEMIRSRSPVSMRECPPGSVASPLSPLSPSTSADPSMDMFSSQCVYYRGRDVRPAVFVDEEMVPTPFDMLSSYSADEIHTVEYYEHGTHIRVYTKYFVGSGKALLPIGAAFRRRF